MTESVVDRAVQPSLSEVFRTLWSNVTFRHVLLGFSVIYFFGYGMGKWQPTFFIRSFAMNSGELGTWLLLAGWSVSSACISAENWLLDTRLATSGCSSKARWPWCSPSTIIQACIYLSSDRYVAARAAGAELRSVQHDLRSSCSQ